MSGHMKSLKNVDPWLIVCDFLHDSPPSIMFSTYPNSRNASEYRPKSSINRKSWWNPISLMLNIHSESWNKKRGSCLKVVKMYKTQWSQHTEEEATWETEDYLHRQYPGFLSSTSGTLFSVPNSNDPISGRDYF